MFKDWFKKPAGCIFAGITALQTVICIIWIISGISRGFSFGMLFNAVVLAVSSVVFCGLVSVPLPIALFVLTSPFVWLVIKGDKGLSLALAFMLVAAGVIVRLFRLKRFKALFAFVILAVFGAVSLEKSMVFAQTAGVSMSPQYLLYENTVWSHILGHGFKFSPEFIKDNFDLLNRADADPYVLRSEVAPLIEADFGKKAFVNAAEFTVKMGTKGVIGENLERVILMLTAPLSFFICLFFNVPDTFVAANILDLTGGSPVLSMFWLIVSMVGTLTIFAGTLVVSVIRGEFRAELKLMLKFYVSLLPVAIFLSVVRLPAFDVRDAGAIVMLTGFYWAVRFLGFSGGSKS